MLDFGSGKGYLSEHLSVTSQLRVVGIDALSSNTEGAQKRNHKIQKAFKFTQHPSQATNSGVHSESDSTSSLCEHQQCSSVAISTKNYLPITKVIDNNDVGILLTEVEHLSGGLFFAAEVRCFKSLTPDMALVPGHNVGWSSHMW